MNKPEVFFTTSVSTATGKAQSQMGVRWDVEDKRGLIHRQQGFTPFSTDPKKQAAMKAAIESGEVGVALGQPDRRNQGLFALVIIDGSEEPIIPQTEKDQTLLETK
jgi:hypothetical protein